MQKHGEIMRCSLLRAKADLERIAAPAGGFAGTSLNEFIGCGDKLGRTCRIRGGTPVILLEGHPINEA
jgi:hypothetical protein